MKPFRQPCSQRKAFLGRVVPKNLKFNFFGKKGLLDHPHESPRDVKKGPASHRLAKAIASTEFTLGISALWRHRWICPVAETLKRHFKIQVYKEAPETLGCKRRKQPGGFLTFMFMIPSAKSEKRRFFRNEYWTFFKKGSRMNFVPS